MTILFRPILFVCLFMTVLAWTPASHATSVPGADVYGHTPAYEGIRISHDAGRIAFFESRENQHVVSIRDLNTNATCGFAMARLKVRELIWAPQDRLLIRVSPSRADLSRYISINVRCADPRLLFGDNPSSAASLIGWAPDGRRLLWTSLRYISGRTVAPSPGILGWNRVRSRYVFALDVIAVDPVTGASDTVERGSERTVAWLADADGNLRIRVDEERDESITLLTRPSGSGTWGEAFSTRSDNVEQAEDLPFLAVGPAADSVYVLTRNGGDKRIAQELSLRSKALAGVVFQHNQYDVTGYQLDEYTGQVIGVSYIDDLHRVVYIDPSIARSIEKIRGLFRGAQVNVKSASRDRKNLVVRVDGPDHPTGTYFLANMSTDEVSRIGQRYPAIAASNIAPVKSFSYTARDGLKIPAYLTLPPQDAAGKRALVVMPHGGPEARDSANFDPWAQFLATRGYVVLQPQFRGSDGFGYAFRQAGRRQWGLKMQDDITDGVKALIADGKVDPSRICIFGWSYGGYAAMAGLAFSPEVYKCGIAGAGVSDIPEILGHVKRQSFGGWDHVQYWEDVIGNSFSDSARLKATSPVYSVKNIRAPLLLLHGKLDTVVPIRQSEGMAKALHKAGKPYEFIELEDDDHWLSYADSEKRALTEIERFLKLHLQ